ncbi:hypothetical protein KBD87_03380 [Candidatus Saccharibacteria bacterium]|nr:hypothetical protein [Candidatus Saccharibacteria bacterium]
MPDEEVKESIEQQSSEATSPSESPKSVDGFISNSSQSTAVPAPRNGTADESSAMPVVEAPLPATLGVDAVSVEAEPPTGAGADDQTVATPIVPTAAVGTMAGVNSSLPKKSPKKKWFLIGGISAVVALLIGGGVFAYNTYQDPNKVLLDGVMNLLTTKSGAANGTATIETGDVKMALAIHSRTNDKMSDATVDATITSKIDTKMDPIKLKLGAVVVKDGEAYIKFGGLKEAATSYVDTMIEARLTMYAVNEKKGPSADEVQKMKEEVYKMIQPFISKVDNQWMKLSSEDFDSVNKTKRGAQKCTQEVMKKFTDGGRMRDEVMSEYQKNHFITVNKQLGLQDGSYGYTLDFDQDKATAFSKSIEKTEFVKKMKDCDGIRAKTPSSSYEDMGSSYSSSAAKPTITTTAEIWVSQWSHQLTAIKMGVNSSQKDTYSSTPTTTRMNIDLKIDNSTKPSISVPSDTRPFKEVLNDIQGLMGTGSSSSPISI